MTTLTTFTTKTTSLTKAEADANFAKAAQAKTALYTCVEADNRDTIECSGTFTVTLPVAATIAAAADTGDYEVTVKNSGTGIITVSRSSTNTIDGATSRELSPNQSETYKVNQGQDGYNIISDFGNIIHGVTTVNTGTSVEIFTSIPSWAKKITLAINSLELSSAANSVQLELGHSGAWITTGYISDCQIISGTNSTANTTGGMAITGTTSLSTTNAHTGHVTLVNDFGTDIWTMTSSLREVSINRRYAGNAEIDVTAALTRIRITSGGFDGSGTISYLIEG